MNNINIVIIGQNEGGSIESMLSSLSRYNYRRVWVLDRCTDNSEEVLKSANEFYVTTPNNLVGRQTSFARNLGVSYCDKESDIIFLDGDRYIIEGDLELAASSFYKDATYFMLEKDVRTEEIFKESYGGIYNKCYSCGLYLKRQVIDKLLEIYGEIFPEELQMHWGIEDTGLGDRLYYNGFSAELTSLIKLRGQLSKLELDDITHLIPRLKFREELIKKQLNK